MSYEDEMHIQASIAYQNDEFIKGAMQRDLSKCQDKVNNPANTQALAEAVAEYETQEALISLYDKGLIECSFVAGELHYQVKEPVRILPPGE